MTDDLPLGRFLKLKRDEAGLSQEKLAERIGVPRRYIHRWEKEGTQPEDRFKDRLAEELSVDREELDRPRPLEEDYRSLAERIAALELATFGETRGP